MSLHAQAKLLRVNRIHILLLSGKQQVQTWKRGRIEPEVKRAHAGVVRGWVTVREVRRFGMSDPHLSS